MHFIRMKLPAGCKKGPARHAQMRVGTVLAGTLYMGFGEQFSAPRMVAIQPGRTWTVPARQAYYLWAKEGDVVLQELGNE